MPRPRVNTSPVADNYADKARERIVEFSSKPGGPGGLISFRRQDDDTLDVHVYRTDPGVRAYVGAEAQPDGGLSAALVSWWNGLTPEERSLTGVEFDPPGTPS